MAAVAVKSLLLFFLIFIAASASAKKEKPLTKVADLRYGVALYHYYQTEYMDALSELLIARERGGIQGHGDNPVIMEGGFALAYGLERYAADVFREILQGNVPDDAQVAAWYYLARMRYMRNDWPGARSSMSQVLDIAKRNKKSTRDIESDLSALTINLAIKQNDLDAAEKEFKRKKLSQDWLPYVYFNIGSMAAREQDFDKAIKYFERIADEKYRQEEYRALYDKAMTAAGYSYLLSGRYEQSKRQFSYVRLESDMSGRALLGYGWAASELGDYHSALNAWNQLSKSNFVDENTQEALVAVPWAYERLGLDGLALQQFKIAEVGFQEEIERLDQVINNLQGDTLLEALRIETSEGIDWMSHVEINQLSPQLSYLIALFSREEFQMRVQSLRELISLQKNTEVWLEKMDFYSDMLDARENDRDVKSALLARDELKWQISDLEDKRKALSQKVETIAAQKDYFALSSGDEAELIQRVLRSQKRIPLLRDEDPFIEDSEEALRWYYGILLWESSEKFSDRLWRAVKTLNSLDSSIVELKKNYRNVENILKAAPDLQSYRSRIAEANRELQAQNQSLMAAINNAKNLLRNDVVGVLKEQRTRIQHYLAQSRLSVARLYDKAMRESEERLYQIQAEQESETPGAVEAQQ